MNIKKIIISISGLLVVFYAISQFGPNKEFTPWSPTELKLIQSLWINNLQPHPASPTNAFADNPIAAAFGQQLFFDTRLSNTGSVACATCHQPEHHFTDRLPVAVGVATGTRNTMSIVGSAYSPWLFWDGHKDSLWSQALGPLESPIEHAGTRLQFTHIISQDAGYHEIYERLFGALPDLSRADRFPLSAGPFGNTEERLAWQDMQPADREVVNILFANLGKAIESYERLLKPGPSLFDNYVQSIVSNTTGPAEFSDNQKAGLRLFTGKAGCINCHNGPLFTNNAFHNTGVIPAREKAPSLGRIAALERLFDDPFNCTGKYSDAEATACTELRYAGTGDELIGAHRTQSLRNIAQTGPYMHAGQIDSLEQVIEHYNKAELALVGHNEAEPLELNSNEISQLVAFLHSLSSAMDTDKIWLSAPL